MKFYIRLLILILFLALGIYFVPGWLTGIGTHGEDFLTSTLQRENVENSRTADKAEKTLTVLKENCGKCHQSTLPTAKPKALAIFDLDKKLWHESVSEKHLESISERIGKKSEISSSDRTTVQEFLACIRKDDCKKGTK